MSELVWMICPIISLLWQLGGTFNKLFRRLGVPVVLTTTFLLFTPFGWKAILLFPAVFLMTTLPVTLKGDSIKDHWFNWVWVWILGYLYGLPSVLIGFDGFWLSFVPCVATGLSITFSNIKPFDKFFQWKLCEGIIGFFMAISYAYLMVK